MRNILIAIFIFVMLVILALVFASFQVRETEVALVTRFGKPVREITDPNLHFKWPPPIERVHKYDSRMRVLEAELGETTAKGAVPIIVNTYAVWRIARPLQFYNANNRGDINYAENMLISHINDTQNRIIGQHFFGEFVNSDPEKIRFEQVEKEMFIKLKEAVKKEFGIEISTVGIKQLKVSEDETKKVFTRMSAARKIKTELTIDQGNTEAAKLKKEAEAKKIELLATADARARAIQAQGDAEAAKYYEMLTEDPDFAMFLRDVEALKKIISERSTLVFRADTRLFKLLREMPDIRPAEPNEPKK